MKSHGLFIILFFFVSIAKAKEQQVILKELYHLLDQQEVYRDKKEQRINEIKSRLLTPEISDTQIYDINELLIEEYKPYSADSAIYYAERNLKIAIHLKDPEKIDHVRFSLCFLYSLSGMPIEAKSMIEEMNSNILSPALLIEYYRANMLFYEYYALSNTRNEKRYNDLYSLYRDSVLSLSDSSSGEYKRLYARKLVDENKLEEAKKVLNPLIEKASSEDREMAYVAHDLAQIYKIEGNPELQKKYYALSAISDVKNSVKENLSLRELARVLYEEKDVKNAYKCIRYATEDAIFSNAQLRTSKLPSIFSIINTAYEEKESQRKQQLIISLIAISTLSLFLFIAIWRVYRQMKKIARIRQIVSETNEKLMLINEELQHTNKELLQANRIKEIYISRFLQTCSMYIHKMDTYRKTINRKVTAGQINDLHKMTATDRNILQEKKELYDLFDETFLTLYPDFVNQINSLVRPEEKIELKNGELLTNELRIFALIRLGIKDSAQISEFLGMASSTTYTYRTKLKSKAIDRDNFEVNIMKLK